MTRTLHPTLDPAERRRLLRLGVSLFNEARFFEAHEAWEEVWRSTTPEPKQMLQGLIQAAVGMFHHLERARPDVARRVLAKARRRLEASAPNALGVDIAALLDDMRRWERWPGSATGAAAGDDAAPPLPRVRVVAPSRLR